MPSASSSGGKERHDTKAELAKKKRDYQAKARDPSTEEEIVDGAELETAYFGEGIWRPSWGNVEFDDDACLKNVTRDGRTKDGYFAPAGTILPLGAALPNMTVLKYGGYFPAGTSFQGGVMIPLHARMVNLLPQETKDPLRVAEESLCLIQ